MFEQDEPGEVTHVEVERVGIISVAKVFGVLYGTLFFFFGILYGFFIALASIAGAVQGQTEALLGLVLAAGIMVVVPVLYGGMAAVMGAVIALVYNLLAARIGGFQFSLRSREMAPT